MSFDAELVTLNRRVFENLCSAAGQGLAVELVKGHDGRSKQVWVSENFGEVLAGLWQLNPDFAHLLLSHLLAEIRLNGGRALEDIPLSDILSSLAVSGAWPAWADPSTLEEIVRSAPQRVLSPPHFT